MFSIVNFISNAEAAIRKYEEINLKIRIIFKGGSFAHLSFRRMDRTVIETF